jgi:phage-related protein (TIGR01555 family)
MSEQKVIYLPPGVNTEEILRNRLKNAEDRIENDGGNFVGFGSSLANFPGGVNGGFAFNPFGLPGSAEFGGEMLSNANTIFKALRWYFVSNFRQVLSEAYVEIGLISTIVDVPVDDAFRGGMEIKSKQLSPEQVEELQISLDRDDDLNTVAQAAKWSRLFGGGGVIILTDQDPRTPLDLTKITEDSPLEFRAVDMWELFYMDQNVNDAFDPSLMEHTQEHYNYYGKLVHRSRVMRLKGLVAPSFVRPRLRGWGFSVVERLVRSLNQYIKNTSLTFELLDEAKVDVYHIKNLVNTLLSPQGANRVKQRVATANQIKNFQNAIVIDSEDEYEQKQLNFSGLSDVMVQCRIQIASEMRIPLTKLFGISAAGFNSGEDDIENYNASVESEVRSKVKYMVLRMIEIKCQKLFQMVPDDLMVTFKPLRVLSAPDEETVKTQKFARLKEAAAEGLITPQQFIDAANKGNLFDIQLESPNMLNPSAPFDTAKESDLVDPNRPFDSLDPGANRVDTRSITPFEYSGSGKGHKTKATPAQKQKEENPTQREWMDAPLEHDEDAQHELKLEKPAAKDTDDAPDPKVPKAKEAKPQKTVPKTEAKDAPEQRRVNNGRGHVTMDNGEARTARDANNKIIKRGDRVSYKGATGVVDGIDSDNSIRVSFYKAKGEYQKFSDGSWCPEWDETGAESVRKMNAGRQDDMIVKKRLKIGLTPALMDKKTKAVHEGRFDQLHLDILASLPKGAVLSDYYKGFMHKGRFIFEQEANLLTQKLWEEGKLSNSADPRPLKRVAVVAVRCGNSLLTGKRRDTGCWTNPGGSCNEGESFEDAAVRELQEETGLVAAVDQLEHLTEKVYSYPDHRTQVVCYTLTLPQKEQARTMNDPDLEVERWRWVDLSPNTLELRSWNREADEDIAVNTLLEGVTA